MGKSIIPAAGELRHLITIQQPTYTTSTTTGEQIPGTPVDLATVKARIKPLSGRLAEIARAIVPTATDEITIRYHAAATVGKQIKFTDRNGAAHLFTINNVNDLESRGLTMVILCTEEAATQSSSSSSSLSSSSAGSSSSSH